jgi:uncharacterized protein YhjY with autotransporter beta-barrel domain
MPCWPFGARGFRLAIALGAAALGLASPAFAQKCPLSDVLQQVSRTTQDVGSFVTPSGNVVDAGGDGLSTNSALRVLTDQLDTNQTLDRTVDQIGDTLCGAVKTLGLRSGITLLTTTGITGVIMGRLDAVRGQGLTGGTGGTPTSVASLGTSSDGLMALGAVEKSRPAPPPGAAGPLSIYATGTFLSGSTSDMPTAAGFSYGGGSGMVGLEYSVNRNLILGLAGSFTTVNADLTTGGTTDADVIHGAAYVSYATRQWFVDALAAYGVVDLDLARPGTTELVRGSTDASAVAVAARTGYLFDFGRLRAGPIAGLTYIRARIDGYTETGNDPSTMTVAAQTVESLTGSAGLRFLAPFQAGGSVFVPYLNVTLEHQFGDGSVDLTTSLTQAPSSPVAVSFPTFGARDYGRVEGGLTVELAPGSSISLSGASTFARDDGQDYRVSGGLNYRF